MPERRALITGVTGQDGAYLAQRLISENIKVFGGFRRGGSRKIWRLEEFELIDKLSLVELEVTEFQNVFAVIQEVQPDLVFNLASQSFVADSFKYPAYTTSVNALGALNVLEAVRIAAPSASLFQASTSEMFGEPVNGPLNERTPFHPKNPYAISKVYAHHMVQNYRETYGLKCCSGVLFNHESPLRGREFVTRKITFNVARLKVEGGDPMPLGNLDAARDWGAAGDYVDAMVRMVKSDRPEDFLVCTGVLTTVRDFLGMAAATAGFDPIFEGEGIDEECLDRKSGKSIAVVREKYYRSHDTRALPGDPSHIRRQLGWSPETDLENLVKEMVRVDIDRWREGVINV